ncbi:uncharacterized protein [Littorina saxatilis]|uniref:uncharacterized protein n=1 Tax=Littorina saxatilis TaxID=31220 RepID=UPI0038B65E41
MLIFNRGFGMGSPLSIVFLLVMLQALDVFCVRIDRGRDTTNEERNKTKAESHGQGTEVTPLRNAPAAVKEEWSRRPPGMAVKEDDKRLSHGTGDTTNTTLLYPPAQYHSDSSNVPETRKPAALTDQRQKKLKDWSGNLSGKSSMTSNGRDKGQERGKSGNPSDKSSMTSNGRDTGQERGTSGNPSDKSSMTSNGRDTGQERGTLGNPLDKSSMTSNGRDTVGQERGTSGNPLDKSSMTSNGRDTVGQERGTSGNPSDKSFMISNGRDTGQERSWSSNPSDKSSMTSDGKDTGRERGRSGKLSDKSVMTSDGIDTGQLRGRSRNPSDKSSMTSDGKDTGQERGRSGKLSDKSSMKSDGKDTGQDRGTSGKLSDKSSMTSDGRDTGEKSWSGNPSDKSSMASDGRDTGEKSWSGNPSDKSSMASDGRDTGEKSWSGNPSDKSSMASDGRDTGEKSWSGNPSDKSSMASDGRDTGEKSWSGNPSDKSSMASDGRDTGEKSWSGNPSDKSSMTSDGRDTGQERSWSSDPSDKSSMTSDSRATGEKRSWSFNTSRKALTTSRPELEATREATKQHHWQDAPHDSTTTAWREEDARQRTGRLKTMNHNEQMERLKTMNHNERMDRLKTMNHNEQMERLKTMNHNEGMERKTMHLNVSSARRDDKAVRGGMTTRSREHPQRKMRQATYGDDEITAYYANYSCSCPRCTKPAEKSNLAQIVYKKLSYSSSLWPNSAGPCGANNGDTDGGFSLYPTKPNGFHTFEEDQRGWWYCDLDGYFTIAKFHWTLRAPKSSYYNRLYHTVVTIDGELCFDFGTDKATLKAYTNEEHACDSPLRGRYVTVQKTDHDPRGTGLWYVVQVQELQIYACLPGHYFKTSENECVPCGSPCRYICDNIHGCNTILNYNVVAKFTGVEMSPLDVGTADSTTDLRVRSALSTNAAECAATGTQTDQAYYRFWRVAKSDIFHVFHFYVTPTLNYNIDLMTNLKFLVMRHQVNLGTSFDAGPTILCKHFTGSFAGSRQKITCDRPMTGSIFVIQGPPTSSLSLCEVEVMGYLITEIKRGETGCGDPETSTCEVGYSCDNGVCKIPVGGNCARSKLKTLCDNQTTCDGGTCKLKLHEDCSGNSDKCKIDTECDPSVNQCRVKLGGPCQTANDCFQSETNTCDYLSKCMAEDT